MMREANAADEESI